MENENKYAMCIKRSLKFRGFVFFRLYKYKISLEDDLDRSNKFILYAVQNNKGQNILYGKDVFFMFFQPIKIKDNKKCKNKMIMWKSNSQKSRSGE